ncbi:hypothetical protein ACS5PJ_14390 [Pseudarthrobacter sp. YS3]|uniref:hypothetical protein n=1 Tax=Pseudarthrobacter sp. YS3 TaxID=3453718 RepID=UPI003EEE11F0
MERVTSWLDLIGMLLVVSAVALAIGALYLPGGVAAGGLGLLLVSWLIDRRRSTQ